MSFDQWQPADPKHPVNSAERNANAMVQNPADGSHSVSATERNGHAFADGSNPNWDPYAILSSGQGDAKYPVNPSGRNASAYTDSGSTAWDPYEALTKMGDLDKTPGVISEAYPNEPNKTIGVINEAYPNEPNDTIGVINEYTNRGVPGKPAMDESYSDAGAEVHGFLSKLGFPTPDLVGFEQEAPNHDGGFWHGLKHLFVKDETNGEKVRDSVLKDMSHNPKEQTQFDQEEKAMKDYRSKMLGWETQMNMNPGSPPAPPDCPMHEEIDKRVQNAEKQIAAQVEASMSPQDRDRLHSQMNQYEKDCADRNTIHNPMGTGEGMRPMPEPGNAIKDYYDRIGAATEKYCDGH